MRGPSDEAGCNTAILTVLFGAIAMPFVMLGIAHLLEWAFG
jgi:hypothetical protein